MKRIFLLAALLLLFSLGYGQGKKKSAAKAITTKKAGAATTAAKVDEPLVPKKKRKPVQDGYIFTDSLLSDSAISYPYVDIKDVIYTKRIWRDIDFRDPGNKVLNSPVVNLVQEIYKAVEAGELDLYENNDENFKNDPLGLSSDPAMEKKFGKKSSVASYAFLGESLKQDKDGNSVASLNSDAKEYFNWNFYKIRLKEDWILDGKRGVFEPRIVGVGLVKYQALIESDPLLTPIDTAAISLATTVGEPDGTLVGWIRFDDLRNVLSKVKIPNENNDFSGITYDDIFMKRLFYSTIIKESTAGDKLKELIVNGRKLTPKELLLESERIKKQMADFEQGLWEY